ncbi:sensor histidine kinase [Nocardioides sp. T2.26MG-1]|uniref:sensor histidine kinase n=1 Tax=Nocardioides sp. T2.26MG-1 TaxID=3041166 RepID=UPI002477BA80|nr:HAMP domain-containing sensor histidine kinase [Nocardioides sp. T2.26MG-1]CAI9415761.1 putative sensor histidine kinase TcrY [Nocardioides sp. T2.26MG-1]
MIRTAWQRVRDALASLTSRLVVTTVLLVLLVSVLIGTATTFAVRSYLTDQLDQDVHDAARRYAFEVTGGPAGVAPDAGTRIRIAGDGPPGTLNAIWTSAGEASGQVGTQRSTGEISTKALPQKTLTALGNLRTNEAATIDVPGVGSYRVEVVALSESVSIAAGLPTSDVDAAVANVIWWEVLLALLAVTAAGGAALIVVRRQLRPLREVAATAHSVSELPLESGHIDITERVPDHLTDARTEVGQVGAALNTLLAHVETSLAARHRSEQQVRQFVADASHELRSPLATIAGYTELARRRPDDTAGARTALDKVEEESDRMTALVEDLLLLARLDAGRPLEQAPVDLTRLLLEAVSDARVVAPDHRWRLDVPDDAVDAPYEVTGDELRLHQVVTNLLSNARRYTPAGTTVTVTVRRDGFAVHDDGPGFPPGLVEHAFERFARGDAARTRTGEVGVGLGLALVQAIVTAHGGSVRLSSSPGDTTLDVRLPG